MTLFACPCCGFATLPELAAYEICPICWWEDDGQDNADADEIKGGPNYQWSLTQARLNFLDQGISCPDRLDLQGRRKDPAEYERVRFFYRATDGGVVEGSK